MANLEAMAGRLDKSIYAKRARGAEQMASQQPHRKSSVKRGKRPRQQTNKQALLNAEWAGMKKMALYLLGPEAVCGICEQPLHDGDLIDADHIESRAQGGKNVPENMQLVHRRCHTQRHGAPRFGEADPS